MNYTPGKCKQQLQHMYFYFGIIDILIQIFKIQRPFILRRRSSEQQ